MTAPGIRIAVNGQGEAERFTVVEFPSTPKSSGHFMSTSKPMTEAEFRSWLQAGGADDSTIDSIIDGARAHQKTA